MASFAAAGKPTCPHPDTLSGQVTITETAYYPHGLTIAEGAVITAPDGYSLTMTVNGVETGQKLVTTAGVDTALVPGTYCGKVVLTVAEENLVPYTAPGPQDHP